jgi:hypothetical protein
MLSHLHHFIMLIFGSIFLQACTIQTAIKPVSIAANTVNHLSSCHAIYDAGSSGTRLYFYQRKNGQWIEHKGAKVSALADPIRANRGKSMEDIDRVIDEVVAALDSIRTEGEADKYGKPAWQAFDWKKQCQLASVQVLATAGMRIAEHENRQGSHLLWKIIKQKLQKKVGTSVEVKGYTLSGFEEGLFAWLAVKDKRKDKSIDFGIAEMGGASTQITFPCSRCNNENNAVRSVIVNAQPQKIYSYSYLGLGQDEAPKIMGIPSACSYGIAQQYVNWNATHCYEQINISTFKGVRDPYNFRANLRGSHNQIPIHQAEINQWVLTGAFNYSKESDIQNCCFNKGQCYQVKTACFRPIYLRKYLHLMGIPIKSKKQNISWTRGAVLCTENDCLAKAKSAPICRWSAQGCLR